MKHKRTPADHALWIALPMAQTSQIEGRLKMILNQTQGRHALTRRVLITALGLGLAALVPLAMLRPTAKAQILPSFVQTFFLDHDSLQIAEEGRALTPEAAAALERTLSIQPDDYAAHLRLLGYYNSRQYLNDPQVSVPAKKAYQQQVFWLIQTHPEAAVQGTPDSQLLNRDAPAAFEEGKSLWLAQIARQPNNTTILGNAAAYCLLSDEATAEKLLRQAEVLEPKSPVWPDKLGELYKLQGEGPNPSAEVIRQSAKKALAEYERVAVLAANSTSADLARTAFDAGEYDKAQRYAASLLQRSKTENSDAEQSEDIHSANLILGRLALRDGDTAGAEASLLAMGRVSGSPALGSFGPNMQLAQDLLKAGRRDVVLAYFDECAKFWTYQPGQVQLAAWKAEVQQGKIPNFGANLIY